MTERFQKGGGTTGKESTRCIVRKALRGLIVLAGLAASTAGIAQTGNETGTETMACPAMEVFYRTGCPHCVRALEYLEGLQTRHESLTVNIFEVNESADIRQRFIDLNQRFQVERPGVPSFMVCGQFLVGFDTASTTGAEIERALGFEVSVSGQIAGGDAGVAVQEPPSTLSPASGIDTKWFGEIDAQNLGLPLFTVAIGLIDGFNPCAMWVLLFLLSLLVNLRDRRRIMLIAGTFVIVSGAVYFAFMAAWLNMFLIIGFSRALQVTVGLLAIAIGAIHLKDFFAFKKGISLTIPESAKPGIYARVRKVIYAENVGAALVAVTTVAIVVNLIELVCTAGLPAIYTQILTSHNLGTSSYYGYLLLYNLAYMFDDAIMVGIVVYTLSRHKLDQAQGRWLKLLSGAVVVVLGLLLVFAPERLF